MRDTEIDKEDFFFYKIRVSFSVRHICLPKEPLKKADDRDGEGVTVAGYGETAVGQLQSTMVTIRYVLFICDTKFNQILYRRPWLFMVSEPARIMRDGLYLNFNLQSQIDNSIMRTHK